MYVCAYSVKHGATALVSVYAAMSRRFCGIHGTCAGVWRNDACTYVCVCVLVYDSMNVCTCVCVCVCVLACVYGLF